MHLELGGQTGLPGRLSLIGRCCAQAPLVAAGVTQHPSPSPYPCHQGRSVVGTWTEEDNVAASSVSCLAETPR